MKRYAAPLAASVLLASAAALGAVPAHKRPPGRQMPPPMAAPPVADPTRPDLASFASDPPAAEATPAPKPEEWKAAPAVRLTHDVGACRAYRVREWLKVHCSGFPAAGVALLAGSRPGVELWVDPPHEAAETMMTARSAEVIFPVRRGDGRLFQIGQFGPGYDGPAAWNLAYTLSEQWIDGDRAPIISLR